MMIHIGYVAIALPVGFAFGWGICLALELAYVMHCRKEQKSAETCLECFAAAAREVLADSWYKKVVRSYRTKVEARCAR